MNEEIDKEDEESTVAEKHSDVTKKLIKKKSFKDFNSSIHIKYKNSEYI